MDAISKTDKNTITIASKKSGDEYVSDLLSLNINAIRDTIIITITRNRVNAIQ